MNHGIIALGFLLLGFTAPKGVVAQKKDTLYMTTGQILIGKLKSMALGKMEFDPDDIDVLTIKVNKVKTIQAKTHLFRLETVHRRIIYTALEADDSGRVKISPGGERLRLDEISSLAPLRGKTGALWKGDVSAGYSYSRSSGIGQLNSDFTLSYSTRRYELFTNGSVVTTQTDSVFEWSNADLGIFGSYLLTPVWESMLILNYQRNVELGLARRYQEGAGLGFGFWSTIQTEAKAISGIVLNQEENTEGIKTTTQVEVPFIILFSFHRFRKPDLTITSKQSFFAGVTQKGRIRHDGEINAKLKIITDFYVNLRVYDHFDNQPPGESGATIDYGWVFGLSYKFSQ